MAKQAEGCAVLRLSKAEGLLRLLRPGQNVPCSSFEASLKGLWGGTMAKQAEGCAVLRLSKAAAGLLRAFKAWPKRAM